MKTGISNFVGELALWVVANTLCVVAATTAVFFVGTGLLGWGPGMLSFYLTATALVTLTWGSWGALIWTRNPALRTSMQLTTLLPGVLVFALGLFGLYVGVGAWYVWGGLLASSLGMVAASVGLNRAFATAGRPRRGIALGIGLGAYPLATTAFGLGAGALWYGYVTNPHSGDWRSLISIATLMVTVMAIALISTVIPAAVSSIFRRAGIELGGSE